MSNAVQQVNKLNAGLCPHGLPPGACPICSGMGGGGGKRVGERPQKAGEMTKFQQNLEKISEKLLTFANQISNNFILKPVAFIISNIVAPVLNNVRSILNIVSNITDKLSQFKQKIVDIQDKLNAIFGEAKAFIEKKISEFVSVIKSKFEGLFKIFKKDNAKDEDTKIDEDKKIFNLKTILHKVMRKKKDDSENQSGS